MTGAIRLQNPAPSVVAKHNSAWRRREGPNPQGNPFVDRVRFLTTSPILLRNMSRRRSFLYTVVKASQAAARQNAIAQHRQAAAVARVSREDAREARRQAVVNRQQYVQHREQEVDARNADL